MKNPPEIQGFEFAGVASGIKKSNKKDLALILSRRPATAAALFTTNRIKSPAILVGMRKISHGRIQAVVVNSGNANACTGRKGLADAETMCREAARRLGIPEALVIPSSTGVIGVPLPMEKLVRGIHRAASSMSSRDIVAAAEAIMTTDRVVKITGVRCRLGGKGITVAGIAKGAGMVAPYMATMLCYVMTDAAVARPVLQRIVRRAADASFHAITIDGDRSTNDTVLCLANGMAGNPSVLPGSSGEAALARAMTRVMKDLALKLVEDGEGATKLVEVRVDGARHSKDAKTIAFKVANSMLVKTAFFGEDPNIGRILVAVGCAGVAIDPDRIDVAFDRVKVVRRGVAIGVGEREAARVMKQRSFRVRIGLGQGRESASVWTSDLSHEYVHINADYRT